MFAIVVGSLRMVACARMRHKLAPAPHVVPGDDSQHPGCICDSYLGIDFTSRWGLLVRITKGVEVSNPDQ